MKSASRLASKGSPSLLVLTLILGTTSALHAQTPLYWSPNGPAGTAGGNGTWNTTAAFWGGHPGGGYQPWPGDGTSSRAIFGNVGGTISVSGAVSAQSLRFEADAYTLDISGPGNSLTLSDAFGFAPRIDVPLAGQTATIAGPLSGSTGLAVGGLGTLVLAGPNTITPGFYNLNVASATVKLLTATGSYDSSSRLYLGEGTGDNGGGGHLSTFLLDNTGASAATAQAFASLNLDGGDSLVQTSRVAAQDLTLTFGTQARLAGATVNYVTSGGANGTTNKIVLTGQAAGYINQGTYFGGSSFAWRDATGYVRAIGYGSDSGATTSAGGTSVTGTHVQLTGALSAQATATLTSLKIAGANDVTLGSGATLTVTGLLKAGGNASTISGGTALRPGTSRELVIRTDLAADSLTINTVISNASGGASTLTKSGAGTLVLGGANSFTGSTYFNDGVVSVATLPAASGSSSPLGTGGASGAALQFSGGTLQYTGATMSTTRKFNFLAGGGGVEVTQAGTTLTLNSTIFGSNAADSDSLIKLGPGTLALSGNGDNSGFNAVVNAGTLRLAKASSNSPDVHAVSTLTVNNGGVAQLAGTGGDQIYDGTPVTVNAGGTLDLNGTSEGVLLLRGSGGAVTNNSATTNSTLTLGGWGIASDFGSFAGSLADGSGGHSLGLVKLGPGTQILGGTSTFTGPTSVSAGALIINGSLSGSAVTVDGATLGGGGTIGGSLQVLVGGTLAPGPLADPSTATLTVPSGALFQGSINLEIGGTVRGTDYDALNVSGPGFLTFGGALNLSFINSFSPTGGEVFQLFNAAHYSGTFASISLPALPAGMSWDTSQLASTGTAAIAVPEPSTTLSLSLLVPALVLRFRPSRESKALASRRG